MLHAADGILCQALRTQSRFQCRAKGKKERNRRGQTAPDPYLPAATEAVIYGMLESHHCPNFRPAKPGEGGDHKNDFMGRSTNNYSKALTRMITWDAESYAI